jgi:hypothetical protein
MNKITRRSSQKINFQSQLQLVIGHPLQCNSEYARCACVVGSNVTGRLFCVAGAMPMVIATVHCMPLLLKYPLFAFYVVLSIWGLYKVSRSAE